MRAIVFDCTVVKKTDKALLIRLDDDREEWIPLSQISSDYDITTEAAEGDEGEIGLTEFIADQRGLI